MSWFAWILSVLIVVLALLYVSPKLRKTAFIWFTYVSLTGWYYFRLWEKQRARSTAAGVTSPAARAPGSTANSNSNSIGSNRDGASTAVTQRHSARRAVPLVVEDDDIEDVVYFEPAEHVQQRALRTAVEPSQSMQTHRRFSNSSSSGNSGGTSDDSLAKFTQHQQRPPKSHLGIFRSLRRSKRDDDASAKGRNSEPSDPLASSTVSEPGTTTRRTYTGRRKKPLSWAD